MFNYKNKKKMILLITLAILSVFISLIYFGDKKNNYGLLFVGIIGALFTTIIGFPLSIVVPTSEKVYEIQPTVSKSNYTVFVEWSNYEGENRLTKYTSHKDYVNIDSNVVWVAYIQTNDWGYSWSYDYNIVYKNK